MTLFSESSLNLDSIRAYNLQNYFMNEMKIRVNNLRTCTTFEWGIFAWFLLYQELLLNTLQLIVIILSCFQISTNNTSNSNTQFIMLSCWYFMAIQQQLGYTACFSVWFQRNLSSAKRLSYYHTLFDENKQLGKETVHEASHINHSYTINKNKLWPTNGNIIINKLQLKYRKNFQTVLDIEKCINIKAGNKIGIVGRTGSGKSSILVSIFRLFEPIINDINI
eukprot:155470_1